MEATTSHSDSPPHSDLTIITKKTSSSCDSVGKSVMSKYTSLREILPASPRRRPPPTPPTPPPASPVNSQARRSEIPIRNPLVQQAALAYLQPMAGRPTVVEQGLFGKFKEVCCGEQCGCLEWFHSVVSMDFLGTNTDEEDDRHLMMRRRTTGGGESS